MKSNRKLESLKEKRIFFIDRDGTVIIEDRALPGAIDFLDHLQVKKRDFFILTNNSSRTPKDHYELLKKIGLGVELKNILVSIQPALSFLKMKNQQNIYWLATERVSRYIENEGFVFDRENPRAILLTYDTEITYEKLVTFCHFARNGTPYYATHPDPTCITNTGELPDIGTFIKVIEMTTNKVPERIFGKPFLSFMQPVLEEKGFQEKDAVMIGDRLITDIKMAEGSDVTSILVLSGTTKKEDYEQSQIKADIVIDTIGDLIPYI